MKRFFAKVEGTMCYTRLVTTHNVYSKRENGRWEVIRGLYYDGEANRYIKALLTHGYTELSTDKVPFCTDLADEITAELRADALNSIVKYRKMPELDFLRRWSTDRRRVQYAAGEITCEKAREFAEKRMVRAVFKQLQRDENRLAEVRNARLPASVSILVEYTSSATVRAFVNVDNRCFEGSAGGYGYDKTSAAVANALNQSNAALNILLTAKERALRNGATDVSHTATGGRDNHACIGYGAGYGVIPYYEGGVGMSSLSALFTRHGFKMIVVDGQHSTCYSFAKKERF